MKSQFSTILVPQGSEYNAVCNGLKGLKLPYLKVIYIPMGKAVKTFLKTIKIEEGNILLMGVAGSLSSKLSLGSIVCYQSCSLWQDETIQDKLTCYSLFHEKIKQVQGITSDRLLFKPEDKTALSKYGDVVDLESYQVLKAYPDRSITILRVISDNSKQRIPDLTLAITPQGGLEPLTLAFLFLKDPLGAAHLIYGSLVALNRLKSVTRELFIQ